MINEEQRLEDELSEKCRRTLEETYGFKIPLPNCVPHQESNQNTSLSTKLSGVFKRTPSAHTEKARKETNPEKELRQMKTKMPKQKRVSSEEFFKNYDTIWQKGPRVTYKRQDSLGNSVQSQ